MRPGIAVAVVLVGCTVGAPCAEDVRICEGDVLAIRACGGRAPIPLERCGRTGQRCDPELGCVGCIGGRAACDGDAIVRCAEDGLTWQVESSCDAPGVVCAAGACVDACELAARESTYLGCEHHAISTLSSFLVDGFDLTVVIGNPGEQAATVRVLRGDEQVASAVVAPRSAEDLSLPRVEALAKSRGASSLVPAGSYRVLADRPVAVYQYQPLELRASPACTFTGTAADLQCFSFTNDASLLLPVHALGTRYLVDARESVGGAGSFVAIGAPRGARVRATLSSAIAASADGAIPELARGETIERELAPGDVLQLVAREGSLAGTEIESDAPLLVIGGADCANVPITSAACDHLEEILPPIDAWGRTVVVPAPRSIEGEPSVLRVISASDDNEVVIGGLPAPIRLDRGQPFELVVTEDTIVEAREPILVTQYLVSAVYFDRAIPGRDRGTVGDPAMGLATPIEQMRRSFAFVVPSTFDRSTAAIVSPVGDEVRLDGVPIDAWEAIEATRWQVARIEVPGGAHTLVSREGASLTLYGVAPFTSYLLPGGLDVESLQ